VNGATRGGTPLLLTGRVVTGDRVIDDGYVEVHAGRVTRVGPAHDAPADRSLPESAGTILPGLVDLHCHGGGGAAVTTGDAEQVRRVAEHHRLAGTTSLLLSTVTDTPERMLAAIAAASEVVFSGEAAGVHLEGPFLSASRCGAQDPRHLRLPDPGLARELVAAGAGHVRVMTVAPELPGADRLLDVLADVGVTAAVGHTDADTGTVSAALARPGVDLVTHLFNGMPPLHHRAPGPVAAALAAAARGETVVELVADGVHLADATVAMVFDLLGPARVALVTDAMAAAGMPDGDYDLGPQSVTVAGGVARLRGPGEQSIAGGTARLLEVVRRCVRHAGVRLPDAVAAASATPATVLGLGPGVGTVTPGGPADLVVVDDDLRLRRVMRAGRWLA
jgi:N-acetylglucosamine-6-phosphate deacetylase